MHIPNASPFKRLLIAKIDRILVDRPPKLYRFQQLTVFVKAFGVCITIVPN